MAAPTVKQKRDRLTEVLKEETMPKLKISELTTWVAAGKFTSPVVITASKGGYRKPLCVAYPYNKEIDKKITQSQNDFIGGKKTYKDYVRSMLEIGMQQLLEGEVKIKPSDIIGAEHLEEIKKKNTIAAAELLLEASKIWAGRGSWHICDNCGHMMLPKEVVEENTGKLIDTGEEEEPEVLLPNGIQKSLTTNA